MNADSETIHDVIQTTQLPVHNSEAISRLLDICEALNRRIDVLESRLDHGTAGQSKQGTLIANFLSSGGHL